jgi:hypothetical protein
MAGFGISGVEPSNGVETSLPNRIHIHDLHQKTLLP